MTSSTNLAQLFIQKILELIPAKVVLAFSAFLLVWAMLCTIPTAICVKDYFFTHGSLSTVVAEGNAMSALQIEVHEGNVFPVDVINRIVDFETCVFAVKLDGLY